MLVWMIYWTTDVGCEYTWSHRSEHIAWCVTCIISFWLQKKGWILRFHELIGSWVLLQDIPGETAHISLQCDYIPLLKVAASLPPSFPPQRLSSLLCWQWQLNNRSQNCLNEKKKEGRLIMATFYLSCPPHLHTSPKHCMFEPNPSRKKWGWKLFFPGHKPTGYRGNCPNLTMASEEEASVRKCRERRSKGMAPKVWENLGMRNNERERESRRGREMRKWEPMNESSSKRVVSDERGEILQLWTWSERILQSDRDSERLHTTVDGGWREKAL